MFYEETDELEVVFLLSAEQADRRVLSHIVHIIGGPDNFVVFGNCAIICIDHSFDDNNKSGFQAAAEASPALWPCRSYRGPCRRFS